ncbi:MAG: aldo/keto reductase [Phycisphaerae bacterium]
MKRIQLCKNGPELAAVSLGTGSFGSKIDRDRASAILDRYVELGGDNIDTARIYGGGDSEKVIGQWLADRGCRDDVFIGTKGAHPDPDAMGESRLSQEDLDYDIRTSLDALQVDCIDLYWLHRDDPDIPVDEILDRLAVHVREGRLRYLGCSNWSPSRQFQADEYARKSGVPGFVASQIGWSLAPVNPGTLPDDTLEYMDSDHLTYHRRTNKAAFAYTSQAKGFFSGRYSPEAPVPDRPSAGQVVERYFSEANFRLLQATRQMAEEMGCSVNQIALAYIAADTFPAYPVVGPRNVKQLEDAAGAGDIELSEGQFARLSRLRGPFAGFSL